MEFMPDYKNLEVPEREFFFVVLGILNPDQLREMVQNAYINCNENIVKITKGNLLKLQKSFTQT